MYLQYDTKGSTWNWNGDKLPNQNKALALGPAALRRMEAQAKNPRDYMDW